MKTKTILITGASSGLGESLARVYANENSRLLLVARNVNKLQELQNELAGEVKIFPADLTNSQEIERLIKELKADNQVIDLLINNAGVGFFEKFTQTSQEQILKTIQLNTLAPMLLTQGLIELMPLGSSIVNVASIAGKIATTKSSIYAASKSALIQFSNVLRMELYDKNIHVMSANFGPIRTPFHQKADKTGEYAKKIDRFMLDADQLALLIQRYERKKKRELNRPRSMAFVSVLASLMPGLFEYLNRTLFNLK
ncbi:MAG: SDR family oxidoreductase [Streptococcaceae bacterium]|nr:SDR family oxidoreductase [Streptococcaceae bacterium]